MIDVNDEVPNFEVSQAGEERMARRPPTVPCATLLVEHVGFGIDLQAGVRQSKPARQAAGRDEDGGIARVLSALQGCG